MPHEVVAASSLNTLTNSYKLYPEYTLSITEIYMAKDGILRISARHGLQYEKYDDLDL